MLENTEEINKQDHRIFLKERKAEVFARKDRKLFENQGKKRKSLRFGMIHRPLLSKGFSILGLKLEDPTSGYILTFEFP